MSRMLDMSTAEPGDRKFGGPGDTPGLACLRNGNTPDEWREVAT